MLVRKQTHISTIEELIQSIVGFEYASVVDFNMGYLSTLLTKWSMELFTIVFPFGYFECQVLPQGAKPATDIFQSRIVGMFASMREDRPYPYLDDISRHKGKTFDECLGILLEIFKRLKDNNM